MAISRAASSVSHVRVASNPSSRYSAPASASKAEAMIDGRRRPPRWASPSPRKRTEPRSIRWASRASPTVDTIDALRALRIPSSSSGWAANSASEIARLTTASPRNSSRSLWPTASSGCSWSQLVWTRAWATSGDSATGRPSRSARAAAGRTAPGRSRGLGGPLVDVVDRVLDGADLLGVLVRDLRPELLLEAHDQLDEVQRVGVQIVDEGGFGLDLVLVDAQLLDHELLQPLVRGGQVTPSSELAPATGRPCWRSARERRS